MKLKLSDDLRVILKAIESEVRSLQDDADRASVEIQSVSEYHKGRASAFAQTRKLISRYETAVRNVLRKR